MTIELNGAVPANVRGRFSPKAKVQSYFSAQWENLRRLKKLNFIFRELLYVPKYLTVLTLTFSCLDAALYVVAPQILGRIIDNLNLALKFPEIAVKILPWTWAPNFYPLALAKILVCVLPALLIARYASFNVSTFFGKVVSATVITNVANRVVERLLRADMNTHTYRKTGDTIGRFSRYLGFMESYLYQSLSQGLIANLISIPVIVALILYNNWTLALFVLPPLLLAVLANLYFGLPIAQQERAIQRKQSQLGQRLYRSLAGIQEVIVAGKREDEIAAVVKQQKEMLPMKIRQSKNWRWLTTSLNWWENIFLLLMLWWMIGLVLGHHASLGSVAKYYTWYTILYVKMIDILFKYASSLEQVATVEMVEELDELRPEVIGGELPIDPASVTGLVKFSGVYSSYRAANKKGELVNRNTVLRDVTFDLWPKGFNTLVGHTGSGKSTAISLIARLYEYDQGEIQLDGVNIRQFKLVDYRNLFAVLNQQPLLFDDTIAYNITYGAEWATEKEMIDAAKQAQAYEFITNFPLGFDTPLGERGINLSGGQRQRVALARAILRSRYAPIVVMDEPTSNLDRFTASEFLRQARSIFQNRTIIAVTHLIIEDADRTVVLDKGQVVGVGTHEELMANCAKYQDLVLNTIRTKGD